MAEGLMCVNGSKVLRTATSLPVKVRDQSHAETTAFGSLTILGKQVHFS
ncbi:MULTISPECIES: hypothetical protein [unclassified Yoonia]|nr:MULTISPECIES: hypothetical protein [unclassified Yoonia]